MPYALIAMAQSVAQVVGAPLATAILLLDGVGGISGWRWLFLLEVRAAGGVAPSPPPLRSSSRPGPAAVAPPF